jgi:glycerophosphoryl diester phosphodiesterase
MKNTSQSTGTFTGIKILLSLVLILTGFVVHAQCAFKPIGHRGGSSFNFPENTLISLEQGFIEDIYAAEVDVQFTVDSVLVLMHDFYIDRTTNGTGYVRDLTLNYLKSLDAGSWKNEKYKGAKVPTLVEALKLANQYHKKLYLNMKVVATKLVARALKEANVPEDIVMLDPDDPDELKSYHLILPHTPMVYFGDIPEMDDEKLSEFYTFLKNNGVIAVEIPADYLYNWDEHRRKEFQETVHKHQLELWAYTVNDSPYFKFLKETGIDGLETDRPSEAYQVFCNNGAGGFFPEKRITGQWDFNQNLNATIGSRLAVTGDSTVTGQKISFGTTVNFHLAPIEGQPVNIASIPAFDAQHALRFFSNIAPEGIPGGLDCDNTYSLVFDLLKPAGKNPFTAILQTSNNNSDDADFFLSGNQNSIGILEQYMGSFSDSTWVRLALVFDLYKEKLEQYLDGKYVGTIALKDSKNGRFCLNNNWSIQSSNFFSDNDGETNPLYISSIQVRNYAMSVEEIRWLGKPKAKKIERTILALEDLSCPQFTEDIKQGIANSTISLTASAGDLVNYRWEMNSGTGWQNITGTYFRNQASSSLRIINAPETLNGYRFRCIAYNDCQTISNEYLLKDIVNSNQLWDSPKYNVLIYPNPSHGTVTIDLPQSAPTADIRVFTTLGAEVFRRIAASGKCEVKLSPGTYFFQIRNSRLSEVKKILIVE